MNKQFGQWGTEYDARRNLGRERVLVDTTSSPVEMFTVSVVPAGARKGTLVMEWGSFRWTAPIVVD